jgi:hypothetical protein
MDRYLIIEGSDSRTFPTIIFVSRGDSVTVHSPSKRAEKSYTEYVKKKKIDGRHFNWLSTRFTFCNAEVGDLDAAADKRINRMIKGFLRSANTDEYSVDAVTAGLPPK